MNIYDLTVQERDDYDALRYALGYSNEEAMEDIILARELDRLCR